MHVKGRDTSTRKTHDIKSQALAAEATVEVWRWGQGTHPDCTVQGHVPSLVLGVMRCVHSQQLPNYFSMLARRRDVQGSLLGLRPPLVSARCDEHVYTCVHAGRSSVRVPAPANAVLQRSWLLIVTDDAVIRNDRTVD